MLIKIKNKRIYFFSVSFVALMLVIFLFAFQRGLFTNNASEKQAGNGTETSEEINFDPPTESDIKRVEDNKARIEERDKTVENKPVDTIYRSVVPVITYHGQYSGNYEVGAYVPGVYEDTGSCSATFQKGEARFSREVKAVKSATSTDCPAIIIPISEFPDKGQWTMSVSYLSSVASGESEKVTVNIQ